MSNESPVDEILVKLRVASINPDVRQYMQQTKILEPAMDLSVGVFVPKELFVSTEHGWTLSPKGLKYLTDKLEGVYTDVPVDDGDDGIWSDDFEDVELTWDDDPDGPPF